MDQRSGQPGWHVDVAGIVVCAIVTVLAYGIVVAPLLKRQAVVAAEYQQLADHQKEASRLSNTLLALRSRSKAIENESAQTQVRLCSTDQMNGRLAELTGLLDRCALEVDILKAGTPVSGPFYDLVPIRVSGQGGYRECRAFLRDLHRTLPDIHAVGFDLKANPAEPEAGGQFRLDLFWYAAKRPQAT
jgi:Tfp pilus assembly protein PilO